MKYVLFGAGCYAGALVLAGCALWLMPRSWVNTIDRVLFS